MHTTPSRVNILSYSYSNFKISQASCDAVLKTLFWAKNRPFGMISILISLLVTSIFLTGDSCNAR